MDSSNNHVIDPAFAGMSFADVCALAQRQQAQIKHISALNANTHTLTLRGETPRSSLPESKHKL